MSHSYLGEPEKAETGNLYLYAAGLAQPEVQEALRRFREEPESLRQEMPFLWWLLGESTQNFKMSKEDAQYQEHPDSTGAACGNCEFLYRSVKYQVVICSQVRGVVAPKGWCRLWEG